MSRSGARPARIAALLILAACNEPGAAPGEPIRAGRFGSLRDLVLLPRPQAAAGAFLFVDRFEVTIGDWRGFAATEEGRAVGADEVPATAGPSLPIALVDLRQARAFAHWRFCRLPRLDEWRFACVGDGRSRFPWGNQEIWTRANTGDLGLGQATPVGTFESGRRVGGDQPYDLIGNVSEWTETVGADWWSDSLMAPSLEAGVARQTVRGSLLFAPWLLPGGIPPVASIVAAGGAPVPRAVVGADFQTSMLTLVEPVPAGDRRLRTGLRLFTTAAELVARLCREAGPLAEADTDQVRQFVRRDNHRPVLAAALAQHLAGGGVVVGASPLTHLLQQELAGSAAGR